MRPAPPPPAGHDGSLLDLVERARPRAASDPAADMEERYGLGDFSGALRSAELVLDRTPDHAAALRCHRAAAKQLEALLCGRLEQGGRVPVLDADAADRRWLALDARVAALLPWLDGVRSYDEVVLASGLTRLAGLKALVDLLDAQVVRLV